VVVRSVARHAPASVVHWPAHGCEEVLGMAKFAVFFSYKAQTWDQMLKKPGDRAAAVRDLASSVGGSVEALYEPPRVR